MPNPQPTRLEWCQRCCTYTADKLRHQCSDVEARRAAVRRRAETLPRRLEAARRYGREYKRHAREAALDRRKRVAP